MLTFYKKVVVTGHIIEIYELKKVPYVRDSKAREEEDQRKDTEYECLDQYYRYHMFDKYERALSNLENFVENKNIILQKKERKEERRLQTLRDSKNLARRLALTNFDENNTFITLTYAENMTDIGQADKDFAEFIETLNHDFDKKHKYLAVREFQERGAIHYHLLIDFETDWQDLEERKKVERDVHKFYWKHGWVDIQKMDRPNEKNPKSKDKKRRLEAVENVGLYIIKYMTKEEDDERLKGKKSYLTSKGLIRPFTYLQDEAETVIQAYGLDKLTKTFGNVYNSEFLGEITYKEFNMKKVHLQENK